MFPTDPPSRSLSTRSLSEAFRSHAYQTAIKDAADEAQDYNKNHS